MNKTEFGQYTVWKENGIYLATLNLGDYQSLRLSPLPFSQLRPNCWAAKTNIPYRFIDHQYEGKDLTFMEHLGTENPNDTLEATLGPDQTIALFEFFSDIPSANKFH